MSESLHRKFPPVVTVLTLLSLLLFSSQTVQAANPLAKSLDISFAVSTDGSRLGDYAMRLESARNIYTIQSTLTPRGIAQLFAGGQFEQRSRFLVRKGRVVPLVYHERREGGEPPEWQIRFDWTAMKIELPNSKIIDIPRQPVDAASASMQVMMTPPSEERDLKVHVVSDNGVRQHIFSFQGNEEIDTAIGKLKTITIRQRKLGDDESKYVDIWLAPEKSHVPVRIIRNRKGRKIVFEISDLKIGGA